MTPTTIIEPLFRTGVLLQLAGTAAAHEDNISTQVLAEIASAVDSVNRAIARLMADHDLQAEDLQPLLDAITAEMSGGDPE